MKVIILSVFLAICLIAAVDAKANNLIPADKGVCTIAAGREGDRFIENNGKEVVEVESVVRYCDINQCSAACMGYYWSMCCHGSCYCMCQR